MRKEIITYTDCNGVERTEDFYFNISKAEAMERESATPGGYTAMLNRITEAKDYPSIAAVFKEFILDAYGEKSLDGKYFLKKDADGHRLSDMFEQSEAYSTLYMKLATDADAAAVFIRETLPKVDKQAVTTALPSA